VIRDADTAKRALELLDRAHALLMESLTVVKAYCSDEEYKAYRAEMATILADVFFRLMNPIYCYHPALAPPDAPPKFVEEWKKFKASIEEPGGEE
jgi:hypothetical protein